MAAGKRKRTTIDGAAFVQRLSKIGKPSKEPKVAERKLQRDQVTLLREMDQLLNAMRDIQWVLQDVKAAVATLGFFHESTGRALKRLNGALISMRARRPLKVTTVDGKISESESSLARDPDGPHAGQGATQL